MTDVAQRSMHSCRPHLRTPLTTETVRCGWENPHGRRPTCAVSGCCRSQLSAAPSLGQSPPFGSPTSSAQTPVVTAAARRPRAPPASLSRPDLPKFAQTSPTGRLPLHGFRHLHLSTCRGKNGWLIFDLSCFPLSHSRSVPGGSPLNSAITLDEDLPGSPRRPAVAPGLPRAQRRPAHRPAFLLHPGRWRSPLHSGTDAVPTHFRAF